MTSRPATISNPLGLHARAAAHFVHTASRFLSLIRVARAWRALDEAAAEAWLVDSPLSEEARAKVRDPDWKPGAKNKRS